MDLWKITEIIKIYRSTRRKYLLITNCLNSVHVSVMWRAWYSRDGVCLWCNLCCVLYRMFVGPRRSWIGRLCLSQRPTSEPLFFITASQNPEKVVTSLFYLSMCFCLVLKITSSSRYLKHRSDGLHLQLLYYILVLHNHEVC